jgi:hypothetical protein
VLPKAEAVKSKEKEVAVESGKTKKTEGGATTAKTNITKGLEGEAENALPPMNPAPLPGGKAPYINPSAIPTAGERLQGRATDYAKLLALLGGTGAAAGGFMGADYVHPGEGVRDAYNWLQNWRPKYWARPLR